MFKYESELFYTTSKWGLKDSLNESDLVKFDQLINERAKNNWLLVSHFYIPETPRTENALFITFKKKMK